MHGDGTGARGLNSSIWSEEPPAAPLLSSPATGLRHTDWDTVSPSQSARFEQHNEASQWPLPSSSGDVEPRPAPQQGAFQITSQSNTGHSASQKSQTAQETRQVIDQWDPKKRQSLEQLFGVARVGSSARDPRASPRSQATAFSQASFGSGNPHTPRSQASLFNVLAAATDSAPSQRPDHFLTHEKTKQVSEERNIANRRSANMADIAEHPSSPGNSSDYSASHPSTITSLSIPSTRSHSDDKSLAASVPNHPGSNWGDFGFPSEGARLQRRLSQRDPSPASSPKSPTRTLEASFMNLNTETLPEDEDAGSFEGGMASTNVSPFTRDGRMPLPPLTANVPAPRTREHSLGPVGSGRRNTGTWNGPASATAPTRAFVFDDNESDEEGAASRVNLAASRRHSLATFPGQSQVGFQLPASPSSASRFSPASTGPRELLPSSGVGSSALRFNDDELVDSLNSLHLNLDHQSSSASTAAPAASPRHSHIGQPFIVPRPQSFGGRRASSSSVEGVYQPMMGPAGSPRMSGGAGIPQPGSPFFNPSANPAQTQLQGYPPMSSSHMPSNNGRVLSASAHPLQSITPGFTDPNSMPTYFGAQRHQEPDLAEFGRGVPLHQLPPESQLFVVEFKASRTDIFFSGDPSLSIGQGDVVIVEADRGKDLGTVIHDNISLSDVQAFQKHQVEQALSQLASQNIDQAPNPHAISRLTKEVHPKRILSKASPTDLQLLSSKAADEAKALALCRSKVLQKNLEMLVTDAEWQFDRRKLTLFYVAEKRIDFRELVRELFRLFKTRIWLSPKEKIGEGPTPAGRF